MAIHKLVSVAFAAAVIVHGAFAANPTDEKGEYYLDEQGVKHYYVFWDASTSAWNYNFSWTREAAAAGSNTYGGWKNNINGDIWTFGKSVGWPASRYITNCNIYGLHFESNDQACFRYEIDSKTAITCRMALGAYGIRSASNYFNFKLYSVRWNLHLAASQTWSGPAAEKLSANPFFITTSPNDIGAAYETFVTAEDDATLTLQGDLVYNCLDRTYTNNLSNADIVIKKPALLALVGFWKDSAWRNSYLRARSITIDGGVGIYFGKRTTNEDGETVVLAEYNAEGTKVTRYNSGLNGDSRGRYAIGSAPVLTTNVAAKIILKNGATLTAETETSVSTGVKIVVPAGETAYLKGAFKFTDNLTQIEIGEGGYLDISAATFTGSATITGKGTFGPASVRYGTDTKGDWYLDNTITKRYFLYQNTFTGTRWSMNGNSYTRAGAQAGTGAVDWQNNSIFTCEKDTSYSGAYSFGSTRYVCGFRHEAANSVRFEGGQQFRIGSYGIKATTGAKQLDFYAANANPILTANQTWEGTNATELSATPYVVNVPFKYSNYISAIAANDDVVWTLAGDIVVSLKTMTNDFANADVVIKKPAVLSIPVGTSFGTGRLKARSVTLDGGAGIRFGADTSVSMTGRVGNGGYESYGIGSSPVLSPEQVAGTIILTNGATLLAKAVTTVSGGVTIIARGAATTAFVGAFTLADSQTAIQIEEGATLDLSDSTITGDSLQIGGKGTVIINLTKLTAPFTLASETKAEYTISGEGRFYVPDETLAQIGGDIRVTAGTLVIDSAASIPAGRKIVTAGSAELMLIDATLFDPETMMGGTKKVAAADPLIVTAAPRTGIVGVGAGETIEIWGNGLGADATLFATNGATILFKHGAEIAASLVTTNAVNITASDASVTGVVSGAWISGASLESQYISMRGPGLVRFTGGATLRGTTFWMRNYSNVEITDQPFYAYVALYFKDGHLTIKDGGKWQESKEWLGLYMNQYLESSGKAVLEIGKGGTYWRGNNTQTIIGQADDSTTKTAKLYINGGYFETAYTDTFRLNGNGIIEVDNGGYMSCECAIGSWSSKPRRVILGDGIWGNEAKYSGLVGGALFADGRGLSVEVTGNMLFDFNRTFGNNVVISNIGANASNNWTFQNGSTCRVRGRSDKKSTFILNGVTVEPGARFDLCSTNPVADVKFACGGADLAMTWVVPAAGQSAGKVIGDGGALTASYYVPTGATFNAADYNGWHEGFGESGAIQDLTFEADSTFHFPFFGSGAAMAIAGTLTLPEGTNNYQIVRKDGPRTVKDVTVLTAAGGIEGDCTWRCTKGARDANASLVVDDNALKFSYKASGALMFVY